MDIYNLTSLECRCSLLEYDIKCLTYHIYCITVNVIDHTEPTVWIQESSQFDAEDTLSRLIHFVLDYHVI